MQGQLNYWVLQTRICNSCIFTIANILDDKDGYISLHARQIGLTGAFGLGAYC